MVQRQPSTRVYSSPRVTFDALCRFMSANSELARTKVLREQKYKNEFIPGQYGEVRNQLREFVKRDIPLDPAARGLRDCQVSVLEQLDEFQWYPAGTNLILPRRDIYKTVEGVKVKTTPDFLLSTDDGRAGAVKLILSKTGSKWSTELGASAACLLHAGLQGAYPEYSFAPGLVWVVNVRKQAVQKSTGRYDRLLQNVEAACLFINGAWTGL